MTGLGIVTGMAAEARLLNHTVHRCLTASGDPAAAARSLIAQGAGSLMSFGIAGGLDEALLPGTVIVATCIIDCQGERFDCHPLWRDGLMAALDDQSPVAAALLGSDRPLATIADKRSFAAAAVDMESHILARVAAGAGLPFAAIRAIADPAMRALPSAALAGWSDRGETRIAPVLWELAHRPWQLPALLRVALDTRKALAALGRCADSPGLLFGGG